MATTTVNIRSGAGTNHRILGELSRGQRISVVGKAKAGWVKVDLGGSSAAVASKYLNRTGRSLPAAPTTISTGGTKLVTETVNVRSGPGAERKVVGSLRVGSRITLTGRLSHGFAQTSYRGHLRWVSATYLASAAGSDGSSSGSGGSENGGSGSYPTTSAAKGRQALAFAESQLGKPYRYGATGPSSYDCSGLVLTAWRSVGVSMPRTSQQQYAQGHRIAKSQLRAGDLVFFYGARPSHVAMYVGNGMVIHAPRPGKNVQYIKMSYMPYAGAVRPV
ncbi:NlpC/P60 family protein [uncultured Friedmanniella sp.]|uniref:C40 family peptidase n=1 Tax=uncultured Friedmanniella sp. TaxID=335381 RepID=UPI0035C97A07